MRRVLPLFAVLVLGFWTGAALRPSAADAAPKPAAAQKTPSAPQLHGHLGQVKAWVDSLHGLRVAEARALFGSMRPEESTWKHDDQGGPQLSYNFPDYEIELYCTAERVVLVSIDFYPE